MSRTFLRHTTNTITKLSILLLKAILTAIATFLVPRTIQAFVQCFDELYEMLSRRARSPWKTSTIWDSSALVAMAVLIVWNHLLSRLSHNTILDSEVEGEEAEERLSGLRAWSERKPTWERIMARLIIPTLLGLFMFLLAWKAVWVDDTRELVKANTVDPADDILAGLVWRDR